MVTKITNERMLVTVITDAFLDGVFLTRRVANSRRQFRLVIITDGLSDTVSCRRE